MAKILFIKQNVGGNWLESPVTVEPGKLIGLNAEGEPVLVDNPIDDEGAVMIGTDARLLPVDGGFKTQVRPAGGGAWQEVESTVADPA